MTDSNLLREIASDVIDDIDWFHSEYIRAVYIRIMERFEEEGIPVIDNLNNPSAEFQLVEVMADVYQGTRDLESRLKEWFVVLRAQKARESKKDVGVLD